MAFVVLSASAQAPCPRTRRQEKRGKKAGERGRRSCKGHHEEILACPAQETPGLCGILRKKLNELVNHFLKV